MQDPDNKLREYVLKKQQQRERARILRAQRRNQEYDQPDAPAQQYPTNQYQKYRTKNRIIGDPFATSENKENTFHYQTKNTLPAPPIQQLSSSYDDGNYHSSRGHAVSASAMRPRSKPINSYRQHHVQHPPPSMGRPPQKQQNNEAFNNKILSMMEVFKSEINALNEEVNELKTQNQELKQSMVQMQSAQRRTTAMPAISIPKYSNASSNSSFRSSMGSGQNNCNTLNPPKSIRMSKSLRKLKIKKKQHSARLPVTTRNDDQQRFNSNQYDDEPRNHQYNSNSNSHGGHPMDQIQNTRNHQNDRGYNKPPPPKRTTKVNKSMNSSYNKHAASANAFIDKLSELEGVTEVVEQQRIECRGCGRKFIRSALERHAKICKKVFQTKRKKFNIDRVDKDAKNAQNSGGCDENKLKKMRKKKKQSWKAKSGMLRDAIRASKGYDHAVKNGLPTNNIPYQSSTYDDRVECPHCNRKFNEQAAERHIPKCRDIRAKPKTLRRRR